MSDTQSDTAPKPGEKRPREMPRSKRLAEGRKRAGEGTAAPQKRWFRQRAHCNPLASQPLALEQHGVYVILIAGV